MVTLFALGFYLGEPVEVTAFCDDRRYLMARDGKRREHRYWAAQVSTKPTSR
jgi:hypothetical protein